MVEFKLFGIPVRIEAAFWVSFLLFGLLIIQPTASDDFLTVALFVLAAFLSILICEMGHALMIRKYKLPALVHLVLLGGTVHYSVEALNRKQSFFTAAAGPGIQIIIALSLDIGVSLIQMPDTMLNQFIGIFTLVSYFWAAYSCLPVYPLNGGKMLASILGPNRLSTVHLVSMVTSFLVAVAAIKFGYIIIAVFMFYSTYQNYQYWQRTK